jgi:hypothetical protein
MTRMQDGSTPPRFQSQTSVPRAAALGRTMEAARVRLSDGDEPPVRNVLVSYDEFKQRRRLRRRVMAAFERLERGRTLIGECRAVTDAQAPATGDETP